jgi:diadenosine tetraphosphate (Ap4A) HIT family hydrolase
MPHPLVTMFELHPAFPATSRALGDLALCHARLQADARFPWVVLIPRIAGAVELEDLSGADRGALMQEVVLAGSAVRAVAVAMGRPIAKLNVGQLGNITSQLHIHIVGRRPDDAAWPGPVWGAGVAEPYGDDALERAVAAARRALAL